MNNNLPKFVKVSAYEVVQYLEKGYEIIAQHQETHMNSTGSINGNFMNNPISLNNVPTQSTHTYYVMKRGPAAEVLYGDKNENK